MKLRAKITGPRVHGVGYRNLLLNEADNLGLIGFSARNARVDGHQVVLVLVEGDLGQVVEFKEFLQKSSPEAAEVYGVTFEDYEGRVERISTFSFKFQSIQVSKGIDSILRIEKAQYQMLDKQDQMLDKQDQMLDKQDQMLGKQDESIGLLKGVKDDTSAIRKELHRWSTLEDKVEELTQEIVEIKADISEIKAKVS